MNGMSADATTDGVPFRRGFAWSRALAGLTPSVALGIAALLFIRIISASLDKVVVAVNNHDLQAWIPRQLGLYCTLLVMAVPMVIGIIATANLGPQRGARRVAALATAVVVSTGVGVLLRVIVADYFQLGSGWQRLTAFMLYTWPRYAVLGGLLTVVGEFYRREVISIRAMREAEADRATFEREMLGARLQVLQAQIEPHFLFNTLANVRRLYEKDRRAGRMMLENLMRYLEVALPRMRDDVSTLGRDAELIDAFLRIQQIRMGRRLVYGIDIPPSLRDRTVPPMMLLTLVENAIKHGLSRSREGGNIRVGAYEDNGHLRISVADTGIGFASGSGGGTGLANIRARLAAQFGDRAELVLENNDFGGATATILLPPGDRRGN
jgi:signal transduction histidine kinase